MEQEKKSGEKQIVSFGISNTFFGIDVMSIKEVLYLTEYTEVPDSLPFMKGVIDLRGSIVPIVDARIKFNLPPREYDSETVVIIFNIINQKIGFVVDHIFDVITIPEDEIQEASHYRSELELSKDYIEGIIKTNDNIIIILNPEKILSSDEIDSF